VSSAATQAGLPNAVKYRNATLYGGVRSRRTTGVSAVKRVRPTGAMGHDRRAQGAGAVCRGAHRRKRQRLLDSVLSSVALPPVTLALPARVAAERLVLLPFVNPLCAMGTLDLAHSDPSEDHALSERRSGRTLSRHRLHDSSLAEKARAGPPCRCISIRPR